MDTIFFIASKVAQFCIEPLNWVLLLVLFALLFLILNKTALAKRLLVFTLLDLLLIAWLPTSESMLRGLEDSVAKASVAELSKGDFGGIVILGGAIESGEIGPDRGEVSIGAAAERVTKGLEIIRKHPELPFIYSGFSGSITPRGVSEADAFKQFVTEQGISEKMAHYENQSRNTYENVLYIKPLMEEFGAKNENGKLKSWILISSASHMYRSLRIFEKQGLPVVPLPVDYQTAHHLSWTSFDLVQGAQNWNRLLHELIGLLAYWITGKI
jgi:uncharacterized SAM-binding protein YcdF (DUF218 family)